jgi:hypothetical protein
VRRCAPSPKKWALGNEATYGGRTVRVDVDSVLALPVGADDGEPVRPEAKEGGVARHRAELREPAGPPSPISTGADSGPPEMRFVWKAAIRSLSPSSPRHARETSASAIRSVSDPASGAIPPTSSKSGMAHCTLQSPSRGDRVKTLCWESGGFFLYYKRLGRPGRPLACLRRKYCG